MATKISGILTPHMVPLDPSGRINKAELRRYVDWLIQQGVHGLYLHEFHLFARIGDFFLVTIRAIRV